MKKIMKLSVGIMFAVTLFGFFAVPTPASAMTCNSATLTGNVITGTPPTHARFTYSTSYSSVANGQGTPTQVQYFYNEGTFPIEQFVSGLSANTTYFYRLEVTNNYGTNNLNIEQFTTPSCGPSVQPLSCSGPASVTAGTTATFTASGGTSPYNWTEGPSNSYTGSTWNLFIPSWYSGTKIAHLSDASGNSDDCFFTVTQTPPPPTQTLSCSGPSSVTAGTTATFSASGGVSPYSWSEGPSNTYTGSTWSLFIPSWYSGTKIAHLRDANGNSDDCFFEVIQTPPPTQTLSCSGPASVTAGTTATFSASGGTSPYNWTEGPSNSYTGSTWNLFIPSWYSGQKIAHLRDATGGYDNCTFMVNPASVNQPSGNLTISPSSCTISAGQSTCTVTGATWTTSDAPSPAVVDRNTGNTLSTSANRNTPMTVWVSYPQTIFDLKNGGTILDTEVATASCASGTSWNGAVCVTNYIAQNPTVTISANPTSVNYNGASTVTWSSTNASTCSASGGTVSWPGTRYTSGTFYTGSMSNTATFYITCSNGSGSASANGSVTVTVGNQSVPSGNLTISPSSCTISAGQSTCTVTGATWTTSDAPSPAVVDRNTGNTLSTSANRNTPMTVWVSYPQTIFDLKNGGTILDTEVATASCASGTSWNNSVCVTNNNTQNPTVVLNATPTNIQVGGSSILSWTSANANYCSASWTTSTAVSGSKTVSPSYTTTYSITCYGDAGTTPATATKTITVENQGQPQYPTVNIYANPTSVSYNGSSTISWNSNNATSCSASGGTVSWPGTRDLSGTFYTGAMSNTATFYITCTNSVGSDSKQVTVNVGGTYNQAPIVNLTASQTYVTSGGSTYINWNPLNNPTYCTASNGSNYWSGSRSTSGGNFYTGALYGTTVFTMTCTNSAGSSTESVTVSVNYIGNQTCQDPSASNYGGLLPCNYYYNNQVCQDVTAINYRGALPCRYNTYNYICQDVVALNYRGALPCRYNTYTNNQPTVGIAADSTDVAYNGSTNIRWFTSNATSCTASGGSVGWAGLKSIGPASFYTGSLTSGKTYTLTCTNGYGSATDSVFVNVRGRVLGATTIKQAPTSLVLITSSVDRNQPIVPTLDNTRPHPGDEINYTVNYQNIGTGSVTNLVLRLDLPYEVNYMFSTPNNPVINGNTLIFNLGTLKANGQGTVSVRVRVRDNVIPGTMLNFPAVLSYVDPSGYPQSVTANVSAQVWVEPASDQNLTPVAPLGANVFGAGFFPTSLLGWLLLLILILILVYLAKQAFGKEPAPVVTTHGGDVHGEHH